MPQHNPNASQLTQLAALKSAIVTATATLNSAQANVTAAQTVLLAAQTQFKNYEAYIYGSAPYPGTIDGGSRETV